MKLCINTNKNRELPTRASHQKINKHQAHICLIQTHQEMLHSELRFAGFQRTTEMERGPVRPERRQHVVENVRRTRRSPFPSLLRGFFQITWARIMREIGKNWKKRRASQFWQPHMWVQQTARFAAFTCTKRFRIRSHPENFKFVAWTAEENEFPASARLFLPRSPITYFVLPPPHYTQIVGVMIRNCYFQHIPNLIEE